MIIFRNARKAQTAGDVAQCGAVFLWLYQFCAISYKNASHCFGRVSHIERLSHTRQPQMRSEPIDATVVSLVCREN